MLKVDISKCNGDGICSEVCGVGAANLNEKDGKAYIDSDICIECYSCLNTCPQEAIFEED